MTGKEMSCVGPMYMHFNQNCLEQFDTENFYGPVKRFDFSLACFSSTFGWFDLFLVVLARIGSF